MENMQENGQKIVTLNWPSMKHAGNCRVRKPSAQTNWNGCFIVIVCEAYQEIEIQLNSYGLKKYSDYVTALEVF